MTQKAIWKAIQGATHTSDKNKIKFTDTSNGILKQNC